MTPQTFILFGPSGCGKGTQARLLIEYLKEKNPQRETLYLETGNQFREFIKTNNSYTAKLTKEVVESGGLMPEFMPIWIWGGFLIEKITGDEHIIFDGVSRRKAEASVLDSAIKFYKRENPTVLSFEVSDGEITKRLLARGRKDDDEEGIKKRISWYKENVIPAMEYFKNNPNYKFFSINGEQGVEEVCKEMIKKLDI